MNVPYRIMRTYTLTAEQQKRWDALQAMLEVHRQLLSGVEERIWEMRHEIELRVTGPEEVTESNVVQDAMGRTVLVVFSRKFPQPSESKG